MPSDHMLAELRSKVAYVGYVICEELHEDGSRHFHILLTTPKKFSIRSRSSLDILYNDKLYSGQYEAVKNLKSSLKYVCKCFMCESNMLPLKFDSEGVVKAAGILSSGALISEDIASELFLTGSLDSRAQLPIVLKNLQRTCYSKPSPSPSKLTRKSKNRRQEVDNLAQEVDNLAQEVDNRSQKSNNRRQKVNNRSQKVDTSLGKPSPKVLHDVPGIPVSTFLHWSKKPVESSSPNLPFSWTNSFEDWYANNKANYENPANNDNAKLAPSQSSSIGEIDSNCPFTLADFNIPPALVDWMLHCQPSLFLVGEAGTSKTMFCHALAKAKGFQVLVINHPDAIRELKPHHDMILFDDLNWTEIDASQMLSFIDTSMDKTIRVLHGTVQKRKDLIQAFTLNKDAARRLRKVLMERQYLRRLCFVVIDTPMLVNININITNQYHFHSHIYNNPERIEANKKALEGL